MRRLRTLKWASWRLPFLGAILALPICAVTAEVELSAPVRLLGDPPAAAPMNTPMSPAPPPPQTLVRGLLPQYQDAQALRSDAAMAPNLEKPARRFLLALPDRLLLLEASVTVNGQSYEMVRERRIDSLLAELNKPAPAEPAPAQEKSTTDGSTGAAPAPPAPAASDTPAEKEPAEPASDEVEPKTEPEVPLIPVPSDALEARLRRYASVTGRPPTRDEVRWLLTKWVDGPTLLLLDENFQRFRGTQAPEFQALDRDMDGKLSAEELKDAQQTLFACDVNQNDVVEYTEIAEVADARRRQTEAAPIQALIPFLEPSSVAKAFRRLAKEYESPAIVARFDVNSNGELDESELAALAEAEPDVVLAVSFDANDVSKSTMRITRLSSNFDKNAARHMGSSITVPAGRTLVEFSAVQVAALSGSDQISVGVVNDGYPLLPVIDPNEDGRLTIRELRQLASLLQDFDVNKDGEISSDEVPSTVRVAFGLGPSVHRYLADIRTVHSPSTAPVIPAPEWFTRMDRNKDGDIGPREFLLGEEQFKVLDTDSDGLVSPTEANALTRNEAQAANDDSEPKPEQAEATP